MAQGRAEPFGIGVKAMEAVEILDCSREELPGVWGARNVQIVAAGTGETLPGPVTCGWVCRRSVASYNR